jgi:hypothetical protein
MRMEPNHTYSPPTAPVPAFNFLFARSTDAKPRAKGKLPAWLTRSALRSRRV